MDSKTLRKKFLDFFEKNGHVIIPSSSVVPSEEEQLEGKEKVLFTSAGMQPLIPYLLGKLHPNGKKLADVQKCLRTDDIEEVGDGVHHTFFEMFGNWSLGDYWKDEAIELSFKFLTEELGITLEKLAISVFAGDDDALKDEQSAKKWKSLGIPEKRIAYLGKEHNWWPTGEKSGPCGSDTEMFIWTGQDQAPDDFDPQNSKWVEVWNDVFMEFNRKSDGSLEELPQKNVDTGMGLERMLAVLNGKDNDYETDLFEPLLRELTNAVEKIISDISKPQFTKLTNVRMERIRIFIDHARASLFLLSEGVLPGKNERESVLRRLIRKANDQLNLLGLEPVHFWWDKAINHYRNIYKGVYEFEEGSYNIVINELSKYNEVLKNVVGIKSQFNLLKERLNNRQASIAAGSEAFHNFAAGGIPFEVSKQIAQELGLDVSLVEKTFRDKLDEHRLISKSAAKGKFKGGLADHSETVIKYHTATHLLHQALRDVLGPQVFQKGSNITSERLRFDFSYDKKMTDEEIKKVEDIVNKKIKEDLKVDHMIVSLDEAKKMKAIGLFNEKYEDKVSLYGIGPDKGGYFSLEFCGGPHVEHTGVIGKIKIVKEETISSGTRRIRAQIA